MLGAAEACEESAGAGSMGAKELIVYEACQLATKLSFFVATHLSCSPRAFLAASRCPSSLLSHSIFSMAKPHVSLTLTSESSMYFRKIGRELGDPIAPIASAAFRVCVSSQLALLTQCAADELYSPHA